LGSLERNKSVDKSDTYTHLPDINLISICIIVIDNARTFATTKCSRIPEVC